MYYSETDRYVYVEGNTWPVKDLIKRALPRSQWDSGKKRWRVARLDTNRHEVEDLIQAFNERDRAP
jgi:hypothetical protein